MNTELTYHFGIPTPLDTPTDAHPSPEDWVAPRKAFEAVGLWIRNEADRRAWQSFYSPHVRYAVRHDNQWLIFRGPYRVMPDGSLRGFKAFHDFTRRHDLDRMQRAGLSGFANIGQLLESTPATSVEARSASHEIPFTDDPGCYLLSYRDIQRIRKSSPFLFDAFATTAIQVDTRKVFYQQVAKDRPFFWSGPAAPGPEATKQERIAYLKAKNRSRAELELYGRPAADHGLDVALIQLLREDQVRLLEDPWELKPAYRKDPSIFVAPLFFPTTLSGLPQKYRSDWWFESIANRFIGLEMKALDGHSIEGDLFGERLDRAQTIHRLQQAEFLANSAVSAAKSTDVTPSLIAFFASLEARASGFFSEHRKHAELRHSPACLNCGTSLAKPSRGRARLFCIDCAVLVSHLEKRWQRDFIRRRYPYRFTNRIKLT